MRALAAICCLLLSFIVTTTHSFASDDAEMIAFAVVSEPPKDLARIFARVSINTTVADVTLVVSNQILANPIWKKLEVCHALKLGGWNMQDGFHVTSVRVIDSAMLPMVLQGFAGDCLLKKALDMTPFMD